jgi:DNA polymerase-3 subunit gamma/tau
VLLPGADDDVRGVHARLDRLERRLDVSGNVGESAPAKTTAPPRSEPTARPDPPSAAPSASPPAASTTPPTDAPSPEREQVVVLPGGSGPGSKGSVDVTAVRQMWPEVVERVKEYKRVTWMLLMEQVQVATVDDRVVVLAFTNEGKRRGFSASGHDEIVRQALIDVLGLDRRIDAVLDPGAGPTPASVAAPSTAVRSSPAPAEGAGETGEGQPPAPRGPEADAGRGSVGTAAGGAGSESDDDEDIDPGLIGAQLVERELGGRVISDSG